MASRRSVLFCIFFLTALCSSGQAQQCKSHVPPLCSAMLSSAPKVTCPGKHSKGFSVCLQCTETTSCASSCYQRVVAQAAYIGSCGRAPNASQVLKAFMNCVPTCMKLRRGLRKLNAKRKLEGKIYAVIDIGLRTSAASWLYTPLNGRCTSPLAEIPISILHHYGFPHVKPEVPRKDNHRHDGDCDDDCAGNEKLGPGRPDECLMFPNATKPRNCSEEKITV